MLDILNHFIKNILFYLLSLFYGDDYCDHDDLISSFNKLLLSQPIKTDISALILRLKTIDKYISIKFIDPNERYTQFFQKLITILHNGLKDNMDSDLWCLYLELLIVILPDNQSFFLPASDTFPVVGLKKSNNFVKCLIHTNASTHYEKLNSLSLNISTITHIMLYGQYLKLIESNARNHVTGHYLSRHLNLIEIYQNLYASINDAITGLWFNWLFNRQAYYMPFINNLKLLHNTWLIQEQAAIQKNWLDPWLYLSDQTYKNQLDLYLSMLEINHRVCDVILMRWYTTWFVDPDDYTLGWSDIIIFDDAYAIMIEEKWPLMSLFKALILHLDRFEVNWSNFKQAFLISDLAIYNYQQLIFWQRKIIKCVYFITNHPSVCKKIIDDNFHEAHANNLNKNYHQYKDTLWSLDASTLFLSQKVIGDLKSSQLLKYFTQVNNALNINHSLLLFVLKRNHPSSFEWCMTHLRMLSYNELSAFKRCIPSHVWIHFASHIHEALIRGQWCNVSYYLLKEELRFHDSLNNKILPLIKKLSIVIDTTIIDNPSCNSYFTANQELIFNNWEDCSSVLFRPYIQWLNKLLTGGFITVPALRHLVARNIDLCLQENALVSLKSIEDFDALNTWVLTYQQKTTLLQSMKKEFEQQLFKVLQTITKQKKLSFALSKASDISVYKPLLSPIDYNFLKFIQKYHCLIDHWLVTVHALLLNELWSVQTIFTVNPFIKWLHRKEIHLFTTKDISLIKQIHLLHHNKNPDLSDCFRGLLDNLLTQEPLDEMSWHDLSLINPKERSNEYRTVQKKHLSCV